MNVILLKRIILMKKIIALLNDIYFKIQEQLKVAYLQKVIQYFSFIFLYRKF